MVCKPFSRIDCLVGFFIGSLPRTYFASLSLEDVIERFVCIEKAFDLVTIILGLKF